MKVRLKHLREFLQILRAGLRNRYHFRLQPDHFHWICRFNARRDFFAVFIYVEETRIRQFQSIWVFDLSRCKIFILAQIGDFFIGLENEGFFECVKFPQIVIVPDCAGMNISHLLIRTAWTKRSQKRGRFVWKNRRRIHHGIIFIAKNVYLQVLQNFTSERLIIIFDSKKNELLEFASSFR